MSRNFNEELPFGSIETESIVDTPNDPLEYAEAQFEGGNLQWNREPWRYDEIRENFKLQLKDFRGGDTIRVGIDEVLAERILWLNGYEWNYAE